jgi:hypothetical protein
MKGQNGVDVWAQNEGVRGVREDLYFILGVNRDNLWDMTERILRTDNTKDLDSSLLR